jgi:helicase
MCIPDELDLLQMEGRAGRLGLKEKGYSHLIIHGGSSSLVDDLIAKTFSQGLRQPFRRKKT